MQEPLRITNALSGKKTIAAATTDVLQICLGENSNLWISLTPCFPPNRPLRGFRPFPQLTSRGAAVVCKGRHMLSVILRIFGFCLITFVAPLSLATAVAETPVDLELVIAVDISLSMDLDEQRLQRDGYVAALRDGELHQAIAAGARGRIAITYVEWAGQASQIMVVPWTLIDGPQSARALADRLEAASISRARMTSISSALEFSSRLFDNSGFKSSRRVIDVSGDGPNNAGMPVTPVRDQVVGQGITINGLPIMLKVPSSFFDIPDLDRYYTDCVIGGTGAFMIPIRERAEFRTATRRKLLLEIAGRAAPARVIRVQDSMPEGGSDCLIGEKQWRRYWERAPN